MQYTCLIAFNNKGAPKSLQDLPRVMQTVLSGAGTVSSSLFSLPAMLWPSACQWWHWFPWSLFSYCLCRGHPFCVPSFRGLSSGRWEQYWNTFFWALSTPSLFSFSQEWFLSCFVYDGCTGESLTLAHVCQVWGLCTRTLPSTVLIVSPVYLCRGLSSSVTCFPVVAGPGCVRTVQDGKEEALQPCQSWRGH